MHKVLEFSLLGTRWTGLHRNSIIPATRDRVFLASALLPEETWHVRQLKGYMVQNREKIDGS